MKNSGILNSRLPGLRDKTPKERLAQVKEAARLERATEKALAGDNVLPLTIADGMIENVIGKFELPLGIATNFRINGCDFLIPMAVEEPSVVAATSFMAKLVRENGGFTATSTAPVMRAQIQVMGLIDLDKAQEKLQVAKETIISKANEKDTLLLELGGGCIDIEIHSFEDTPAGPMLVLHLLVDVRDAMGANTVNTMAEHVAPDIETITGGKVRLRILSNLADLRTAKAELRLTPESLSTPDFSGQEMIEGIIEAYALAAVDPYRAATHNKGIMNGIDPVVVATGNDWRAIEAGAHAYAAREGHYTSLTQWMKTSSGDLYGVLEMPIALGLVGGATKTHPTARAALEVLNVQSANELAEIVVCVGLAQNLAALRALASEGIQRGHMALHARNIAIAAGACGETIASIAREMIETGDISMERALKLMQP